MVYVKGRNAKTALNNAILDGHTEVIGVVWAKSFKKDEHGMKTYRIKFSHN